MTLTQIDLWIGKTLFVPAIIKLCHLTRQSQFAVSRMFWFAAALDGLYRAETTMGQVIWGGMSIFMLLTAGRRADSPTASFMFFRLLALSERRACRVIDADRKSVRYQARRPPETELRARLRELANERRRFGYADEIIVTATLRSANVQDIPIAVTAVRGAELDRQAIADIKSLSSLAPSFTVQSTNTETGGTAIRIRGVGTTGNNVGLDSSVGVFIDGIYQSRPGMALGDLLDIERLEILRGPQGTLFGRNTSAGALSITTRRPSLTETDGFVNATYGNYDFINLQGAIGAPVIEGKAGVRLSGSYRKRDGYRRALYQAIGADPVRRQSAGGLLSRCSEVGRFDQCGGQVPGPRDHRQGQPAW